MNRNGSLIVGDDFLRNPYGLNLSILKAKLLTEKELAFKYLFSTKCKMYTNLQAQI